MPERKTFPYFLYTLVLYALLALAAYILDRVSPSGPCNPGMGVIVILFTPFLSAILFIVELVLTLKGRKSHTVPAIIHALVIIGFAVTWFIKGNSLLFYYRE